MKLKGQIGLVTGAGRGIGRAIAKTLAAEGATVYLASRTLSELHTVHGEIRELGGNAVVVRADISREEDVDHVFNEIRHVHNRLDIVVNNAGIGKFAPVREMKISDFDAMWNLNVRGLFLVTRQALQLMEPHRNGIIVNISSLAGKNAFVNGAGYASTKWALIGFSRCLMLEEREFGIRVVTICPGSVDTTFGDTQADEVRRAKIPSSQDIADVVLSAILIHPRAMVSEIDIRPTNPK
jgi:3-oxoacyl-[acyl-carrier protein] reductase